MKNLEKKRKIKGKIKGHRELPYENGNYILLFVGILMIIMGVILLAAGETTLAPIFMVVGYGVIIPAALLANFKKQPKEGVKIKIENK